VGSDDAAGNGSGAAEVDTADVCADALDAAGHGD
jgi:hypothetical protein